MKISVDCYMIKRLFCEYSRDYYTLNGCEALINYFDEVDENMEFDPVAICCDCTEYGPGAIVGFDDMIRDYSYLLKDEQEEADEGTDKNGCTDHGIKQIKLS